jgi:hypothetical protein
MKYLNKIFAVLVAFVAYLGATWLLFETFNTSDGMKFLGIIISLAVAICVYKIMNRFVNF